MRGANGHATMRRQQPVGGYKLLSSVFRRGTLYLGLAGVRAVCYLKLVVAFIASLLLVRVVTCGCYTYAAL